MKFVKIISAVAVATILAASPAFAGGSQSNSAYSALTVNTHSGPGYGSALAGGVIVSTSTTGPSGASTSVQGLTASQTLGHATASASGWGSASANSFHVGGLHW